MKTLTQRTIDIQEAYIETLKKLGSLHDELNACGEGAWGAVLEEQDHLADDEKNPNWAAFELRAGFDAINDEAPVGTRFKAAQAQRVYS